MYCFIYHVCLHPIENHRYSILCASKLRQPITPEKSARVVLEHLDIDPEQYRFGSTKVLRHHINHDQNARLFVLPNPVNFPSE